MKIGTKSLLFGVHQFLIHPVFTLWGWVKLYKWKPKKYGYEWWPLLKSIFLHDLGYWKLSDMDGNQGRNHMYWAADYVSKNIDRKLGHKNKYYWLCLLHSRFHAKYLGIEPSMLCWADKLGTALMPTWLWVFLAKLSGELDEYLSDPHYEIHGTKDPYEFFNKYKNELVPKLLKDNLQSCLSENDLYRH